MDIIERYGEIIIETPNQEHIKLIREVCDKELENGMEREEVNHLYEVYYYLKTGSLSGAWRKINLLKDDVRMKVPSEIYHYLKDMCKNMNITVR